MMKKTLTVLTAVAVALIMAVSAFAVTDKEAEEIALNNAGFTAEEVVFDEETKADDDGIFDVNFNIKSDDPLRCLEFEYDIEEKSGKILAVSIEYPDLEKGTEKNLSKAEAKEIALKHFGKTTVKALEIKYDENDNDYEVEFIDGVKQCEIEVSAFDGTVTEYEFRLIAGGNAAIAQFIAFIKDFIVMIRNLFAM